MKPPLHAHISNMKLLQGGDAAAPHPKQSASVRSVFKSERARACACRRLAHACTTSSDTLPPGEVTHVHLKTHVRLSRSRTLHAQRLQIRCLPGDAW